MVRKRRKPDGHVDLKPEDTRSFIETAIVEATGEALKSASAGPDDLRRLVIPRLATWDPRAGADGAAKRQVASAADLFAGSRAGLHTLAEALVNQRLLRRSGTEGGTAYEIAHEALLRVPPLGPLIYERRERFEQARVLEIEVREWNAAGRAAGRLGRAGDRLAEAWKLIEDEDFGPDLTRQKASVADCLAACATHESRVEDSLTNLKSQVEIRTRALEQSLLELRALQEVSQAFKKATADRMEIMVAELQHRTRNLMAVLQSIVAQTLAASEDLDSFKMRIDERLFALSRVQRLLSRSEQEPVTIGALVQLELDALGSNVVPGRIDVCGPEVRVRNSTVQMLALALHELAIDARRHGALSTDHGCLRIGWQVQQLGGAPWLRLSWIEERPVCVAARRAAAATAGN